MKKSEIIDRCAELVQDSSGQMRNLISSWVNIVLDDIASRPSTPLKSLQREERTSLVVAQREYELASDTDHVFKVFVPAWGDPEGVLQKINLDEYLQQMLSDGTTATGRPKYYTIFAARTLRIHPPANLTNAPVSPTNNDKLTIWKYKDIAHLADTADITEIKIKHTPTLLWGAYSMGARFDNLGDVGDVEGKYERGISRIIADSRLDLERPYASVYRDL